MRAHPLQMPVIELVWDADCPNVDEARASLAEAMHRCGLSPRWQEWRRDDPAAPEHARRAGSPAILVDARDVEGHANAGHACCRIYAGEDGRRAGAPSIDAIARAIRRATGSSADG